MPPYHHNHTNAPFKPVVISLELGMGIYRNTDPIRYKVTNSMFQSQTSDTMPETNKEII